MSRTVMLLDLTGVPTADVLAVARLLNGPPAARQAPALAPLLAEALLTEAALRLEAAESGIVAGVRAVVLPPDLPPAELDALERLAWRWVQDLAADGIRHPISELLERLHDRLLRLRGEHLVRASHLQRALEGADGP